MVDPLPYAWETPLPYAWLAPLPYEEEPDRLRVMGVYLRAFCSRARRMEFVERCKSVGVAPQSAGPRQWPRYQKYPQKFKKWPKTAP